MFLLRHSPKEFDKYFLTVCIQVSVLLDLYRTRLSLSTNRALQKQQMTHSKAWNAFQFDSWRTPSHISIPSIIMMWILKQLQHYLNLVPQTDNESSRVIYLNFWMFQQTPLGMDYKDCLIEKNEKFSLAGIHNSFVYLKQLIDFYQLNRLLVSDIPVTLGKCCPPKPKGRTFTFYIFTFGRCSNKKRLTMKLSLYTAC